jgi:adenylosuccinate synthase
MIGYSMAPQVKILYGGQYGSEGKGLLAAYEGSRRKYDTITTNCGPNSGHTAYLNGNKIVTYHLPISALTDVNRSAAIYLNGGSIIDPAKLMKEIQDNEKLAGVNIFDRLMIHPHAAVITKEDKDTEATPGTGTAKIASTAKGVGRAMARKVLREGKTAKDDEFLNKYVSLHKWHKDNNVLIEVAQGYSLGINAGFWPFSTSRNCTPAQGLADAGLPPMFCTSSMVIRTYPIRVGNTNIGHSGECYPDQRETTWAEIGQEPEYTTVTGRMRRVFTWSDQQVREAISAGIPYEILINFAQYEDQKAREAKAHRILKYCQDRFNYQPRILFGYGPRVKDIHPL